MGLADMSDSMRHTSIGELKTKYAPKELCPLSAGGRAERFPAGQCEHGNTQLHSLQSDEARLRQGTHFFQVKVLQNSMELWYLVRGRVLVFFGLFVCFYPRVSLHGIHSDFFKLVPGLIF